MLQQVNFQVTSAAHNRPIFCDATWQPGQQRYPLVLFLHGFKGFKDWGPFNLVAQWFAERGFCMVKMNFSHNGTTPEQPLDFADLEAFGHNNLSTELSDIQAVMQALEAKSVASMPQVDVSDCRLIGHSRGGAVAVIAAAEDPRFTRLVTWAALVKLGERYPEAVLKKWEKEGVLYIWNARTEQQMPIYWQFVEDYLQNADRLDVVAAARRLTIPALAFHGTADETVDHRETDLLAEANDRVIVRKMEGGLHTFGAKHPWDATTLPPDLMRVCEETYAFIR